MKKTFLFILLLLCFSPYANAQGLKKIVKVETNTSKYKSSAEVPDTTVYNFKNSKLLSSVKSDGSVSKYNYNNNGLVSQITKSNTKYPNSDDSIIDFEYNSDGFLVRVYRYSAKNGIKNESTNTTDLRYEYNIKNNNEFTIIGKGKCTNTSKADCMEQLYVMKSNILTETRTIINIKTVSVYTFKDGNLQSMNKNKNTRENHTLLYTYDNSQSLNEAIMKNLFGDKYFYSLICFTPEIEVNNTPRFSKNTMKSAALEKNIKAEVGIITDNVAIEYNSNNMPVKSINTQSVNEGSEVSPRMLVEETYFYE